MRIYYDFEFVDDGRTIDFISVGMLREDGKEYYAVNAGLPWTKVWNHEWLRANVVPHLPTRDWPHPALDTTHPDVKPKAQIAYEVAQFLFYSIHVPGVGIVDEIELWGWYSAYDHVALAQLFGAMINRPVYMPMYTNDIRQEFQRLGNPQHNIPNGNHNALADAHYHKRLHDFIIEHERKLYNVVHPDLFASE